MAEEQKFPTEVIDLPSGGKIYGKGSPLFDGKVEIRPIMYLALSYDHRIIDGKEAVSFLKIVKESLEQPKRLFLNI